MARKYGCIAMKREHFLNGKIRGYEHHEKHSFLWFLFCDKGGFYFVYDTVSNAFHQVSKPLLKQLFNAVFRFYVVLKLRSLPRFPNFFLHIVKALIALLSTA